MSGKDGKPMKDEPATQKTSGGLEIPVPKREDVMDALKKASKPRPK